MNILLLGGGGREHALAWKIKKSPLCDGLFIAPGNPGTASCGTNLPIGVNDFAAIKKAVIENNIDLLLVGPEEPLVKGIVNILKGDEDLKNLLIVGPSAEAAQLEGSKGFAKAFMQRHNIPTAAYGEFTAANYNEGVAYLKAHALPIVLKADGLAAGKGVVICQSHEEALQEFSDMIQDAKFGEASSKVVVEAFLDGIELSVFVLTDGRDYVLLPEAKDYKRIGEEDTGLNTGGMGAISPVPFADEMFMQKVKERIIEPTINGLQTEAFDYKGFVFFGLIKVDGEPFVIEYNCRMGDPETEAVIPRLQTDLVELLVATAKSDLKGTKVHFDKRHACTVMAVSGGYPQDFEKGFAINGLDGALPENVYLFQAGTQQKGDSIVTSGGRVLCVTTLADDLKTAVATSKKALENIHYQNRYYRSDIGFEFI